MLPGLKETFDMDRLLKRTFLLLCPVEVYGGLLKKGWFSCLELCMTIRKLLADVKWTYTKNFVSTYKCSQSKFSQQCCMFHFPVNITMRKLLPDTKVTSFNTKSFYVYKNTRLLCRFPFLVKTFLLPNYYNVKS